MITEISKNIILERERWHMELQTSQLIPGYILSEDVIGKTKHPIVKKNTSLTKEHIYVLERFSIKTVSISKSPRMIQKSIEARELSKTSFNEKYEYAVTSYKEHFNQWQNNLPINMPSIREFLLPLLEFVDDIGMEVYQLYKYSAAKDYMYYHDVSVAILSAYLAKKMGYEKGEWIQIGMAGLLSNCGYTKLASTLFMKESPLTYAEREEVKKHPKHSLNLVKSLSLIKESVKIAILQHHERLDGSGYPLGILREKIHPYAQIVAVCDTYYAMTSKRIYEERHSPFQAIDELRNLQHSKFDAQIVQTFIKSFTQLSLGQKVTLSNFKVGKITFLSEEKPKYPIILLDDTETIISLEDEQNLLITDFLLSQ